MAQYRTSFDVNVISKAPASEIIRILLMKVAVYVTKFRSVRKESYYLIIWIQAETTVICVVVREIAARDAGARRFIGTNSVTIL